MFYKNYKKKSEILVIDLIMFNRLDKFNNMNKKNTMIVNKVRTKIENKKR
jgi:hypothetical protein